MNEKSPRPGSLPPLQSIPLNVSNPIWKSRNGIFGSSLKRLPSSESMTIPMRQSSEILNRGPSRRQMKQSLSQQNLARFNKELKLEIHRNTSYGNLSQISQHTFNSTGTIPIADSPTRHYITRGMMYMMYLFS